MARRLYPPRRLTHDLHDHDTIPAGRTIHPPVSASPRLSSPSHYCPHRLFPSPPWAPLVSGGLLPSGETSALPCCCPGDFPSLPSPILSLKSGSATVVVGDPARIISGIEDGSRTLYFE
ncbi:hypothetical protein NL676_034957 [Syzygium grande]|nr:hypothetical protein NL676_034957 [Syzygium grande]